MLPVLVSAALTTVSCNADEGREQPALAFSVLGHVVLFNLVTNAMLNGEYGTAFSNMQSLCLSQQPFPSNFYFDSSVLA